MTSTLMIKVGRAAAVLAGSRVFSPTPPRRLRARDTGEHRRPVTSAAHAAHSPLLVFAIVGMLPPQQRTVDEFGEVWTSLAIFGMMFLFGGARA